MEEDTVPGLLRIEEVNQRIAKEGLFFRDYERDFESKRLKEYCMFLNEDLEDCVIPSGEGGIDLSIRNLRRDRNKHLVEEHARQYWKRCCERFLYGPEWECINRRPRPSHLGLGQGVIVSLDPYEDYQMKLQLRSSDKRDQGKAIQMRPLTKEEENELRELPFISGATDMREEWPPIDISSLSKTRRSDTKTL